MCIKVTFSYFNQAGGNVGAMVRNPFKVVGQVGKNEACFQSADTIARSERMVASHFKSQSVIRLLKRLDKPCRFNVFIDEGIDRQVNDLRLSIRNDCDILPSRFGEGDLFHAHFLSRSQKVQRMVSDAFKIADVLQQHRNLSAVLQRQSIAAD